MEYVSSGSNALGAFTVEFGNINLVYSTLDESISTNDSPSKQIFKPDYYFINDPDIPDFQLSVGSDFSSLDISSSNDNFQDEEFYAGFDSEDGETIESVYACFKKDGREYCLKGADSTLNETNKKILTDAFGESFCQRGTNGEAYSCEFGNFTLTINKDGGFSSWWGRACYLDIWAFGCDC